MSFLVACSKTEGGEVKLGMLVSEISRTRSDGKEQMRVEEYTSDDSNKKCRNP